MYKRNMKYVKGNPPVDNWKPVSDKIGESLVRHFEQYAKEKGFDIKSYMEFIAENVIRKEED